MAGLAFFIGKGGVGKTTLSASYAVHLARARPRSSVLLLSTDPAHSLSDIFQVKLGVTRRRVRLPRGRLFLWQVDAEKQFRRFLGKYRDAILDLIETGTIFSRADIAPLLDTTLPGMAEMSALLAIHELLDEGEYDHIVVDTAPIGHTLRLFEMPEHFARFLDFLDVAGNRDRLLAERFGGKLQPISRPFIAEWRRMVDAVGEALQSSDSRLVLVTTAESFSLNESVRVTRALREDSDLRVHEIVLNKAVAAAGDCENCGVRAADTRAAGRFLKRNFPRLPVLTAVDPGHPILGAAALAAFGAHVFEKKRFTHRIAAPKAPDVQSKVGFKKVAWPDLKTPLSLTLGKGGVGKTTISAALAFHARQKRPTVPVTICSTDPAPSLDDIFAADVGDAGVSVLRDQRFRAMEIDSVAEFRRWSERMKRQLDQALATEVSGVHVDLSFDREIFAALLDIVPPGVDEIFAIFRILDLLAAKKGQVVIDMAPTGHALELLRMPTRMQLWARLLLKSLAPHRTLPLAREIAVEVATIGQRVRELATLLQDERRSRVWPVMLAEPLPDRETRRVLQSLEAMGIPAGPLFVNRVIFPEDARGCGRCGSARRWQLATLARLRRARRELLIVRNRSHEIAGARGLRSFTQELWRIE